MSEGKPRTGLWAGLAVAAVLLCMGGSAGAVLMSRRLSGTVSDGSSPTVPRTPVGELSAQPVVPSLVALPAITITAPSKLGGLAKLNDSQHADLVVEVTANLAASDSRISDVVVGYYGNADPTKGKLYVAAATTKVPLSSNDFDSFFQAMSSQPEMVQVSDVVDADPGPLGGYARCGNIVYQELPIAMCAWGDKGSLGVIMWYNKSLNQVSGQFIDLRGEVETPA